MGMNWSDFGLQLAELLLPVITALLVALVGYGVAFLRSKTKAVNNEIVATALENALFEAEQVAKDAIHATNQVLVNDLKAKAEDGKLTKEEAMDAMLRAKIYFVDHISDESLKILEAAIGPVQKWLEEYIEARLGQKKAQDTIRAKVSGIANPSSPGPAS